MGSGASISGSHESVRLDQLTQRRGVLIVKVVLLNLNGFGSGSLAVVNLERSHEARLGLFTLLSSLIDDLLNVLIGSRLLALVEASVRSALLRIDRVVFILGSSEVFEFGAWLRTVARFEFRVGLKCLA